MDDLTRKFIIKTCEFDEIVDVFLINGIRLRGKITNCGETSVVLNKTQWINLSAVSTIQNATIKSEPK